MTSAGTPAGAAGEERRRELRAPARPIGHDHALARREPIGLEHGARAAGGELADVRAIAAVVVARRERPRPGHPDARPPRRPRGRTPWTSRACAASRSGPKTAIPASRSASATPAASGASGPTTTSSDGVARARPPRPRPGRAGRRHRPGRAARCAIPALPGATSTSFTPGSPASFQASACSRPPPPTTRMRVGIDEASSAGHAVRPSPPGGGASAATPARWSGSARARPRRTRSAHRRVRLEGRHVAAGGLGQVDEAADVVDRLLPALELLVDRRRARERGAARGPDVDPPAVDLVGHAQADRLDARQDVELVEHDRRCSSSRRPRSASGPRRTSRRVARGR